MGRSGYITLQICTPICCQIEIFGHDKNGITNQLQTKHTVQLKDRELANCQNLKLSDLTAVRLSHGVKGAKGAKNGASTCINSIRKCRMDPEYPGWFSDYLKLMLDDGTFIQCDLPIRIHFKQLNVVDRCNGDWINVIKSGYVAA